MALTPTSRTDRCAGRNVTGAGVGPAWLSEAPARWPGQYRDGGWSPYGAGETVSSGGHRPLLSGGLILSETPSRRQQTISSAYPGDNPSCGSSVGRTLGNESSQLGVYAHVSLIKIVVDCHSVSACLSAEGYQGASFLPCPHVPVKFTQAAPSQPTLGPLVLAIAKIACHIFLVSI